MVIELDRITKRFGPTVALDNVSLEVREEETLGLVARCVRVVVASTCKQ